MIENPGRWIIRAIAACLIGGSALLGFAHPAAAAQPASNSRRPHQSLVGQTPDTLYFNQAPLAAAA